MRPNKAVEARVLKGAALEHEKIENILSVNIPDAIENHIVKVIVAASTAVLLNVSLEDLTKMISRYYKKMKKEYERED